MAMHRLMGGATAVFCACALIVVGCGGTETPTTADPLDTGVTTTTEPPTETTEAASSDATTTSESAQTTGVSGLYPVSVDGKWGYIDITGAIKIQPQYEVVTPYSEDLAAVRQNGKWGYIDTSGAMVIQPRFENARQFSDGMAMVVTVSGDVPLFGYIDKTGALVISVQNDGNSYFSEGLCAALIEESGSQTWGYIDKTGAMVIAPEFGMAGDFSEGLAGVYRSGDPDRRGYINKNGDWVIDLPPDLMAKGPAGQGDFSDGLAIVQAMAFDDPADPGFRYGYVDASGAVVIQPQFDFATDFSEGLAAVGVRDNGVMKYGYIDKTAAWVIQPQFDDAWLFSEGLAAAATRVSGTPGVDESISDYHWGYIDKTGKVVIPMQYQLASPFSGGAARVENWAQMEGPEDGLVSMAYIDKTGKVIWQGK